MSIWESIVRPLAFRLDPERAHDLARAFASREMLSGAMRPLIGGKIVEAPVEMWGLRLRNRVGLAGGFDKNAEMIPFLDSLGFGFLEAGTVTLRPQAGNPRPRIFRYPRQRALINRLGFNNDGADVVGSRLRSLLGRKTVPILINIGRNRDVGNDEAAEAYRAVYERVAPFAHGVTVNISSPNTPGLRELQQGEFLRELLETLLEERERTAFETAGDHPILVKISPDMDESDLATTVEICSATADGMIATNTTLDHSAVEMEGDEQGGLSGAPLRESSSRVLREVRRMAGETFPLIGVGGIMSGSDAVDRIEAGADLIQLYTGFVYGGPSFPSAVAARVAEAESRE